MRQQRALLKVLENQLAQIQAACDQLIASSKPLLEPKASSASARVGLTPAPSPGQMPNSVAPPATRSALWRSRPYDRDSGMSSKNASSGGRSKIRRALYMRPSLPPAAILSSTAISACALLANRQSRPRRHRKKLLIHLNSSCIHYKISLLLTQLLPRVLAPHPRDFHPLAS